MINTNTMGITAPDFEQIGAVGEIEEGSAVSINVFLVRANLSTEDQAIYDNLIELTGDVSNCRINNTTSALTFDRISSSEILEDLTILDYRELPQIDQDKIDSFILLLSTI